MFRLKRGSDSRPRAAHALPILCGLIALTALPSPIPANLIRRASVIDRDTIEIHGQRIHFHGIDALEAGQTCEDAGGQLYLCGQKSALSLADKISAITVACERRDVDRYGRIVAVCCIGELDFNGWVVSEGWVLDYVGSGKGGYTSEEPEARFARRGLWAGMFVEPQEWQRFDRKAPLLGA